MGMRSARPLRRSIASAGARTFAGRSVIPSRRSASVSSPSVSTVCRSRSVGTPPNVEEAGDGYDHDRREGRLRQILEQRRQERPGQQDHR
jgi:hypothetical protein